MSGRGSCSHWSARSLPAIRRSRGLSCSSSRRLSSRSVVFSSFAIQEGHGSRSGGGVLVRPRPESAGSVTAAASITVAAVGAAAERVALAAAVAAAAGAAVVVVAAAANNRRRVLSVGNSVSPVFGDALLGGGTMVFVVAFIVAVVGLLVGGGTGAVLLATTIVLVLFGLVMLSATPEAKNERHAAAGRRARGRASGQAKRG